MEHRQGIQDRILGIEIQPGCELFSIGQKVSVREDNPFGVAF